MEAAGHRGAGKNVDVRFALVAGSLFLATFGILAWVASEPVRQYKDDLRVLKQLGAYTTIEEAAAQEVSPEENAASHYSVAFSEFDRFSEEKQKALVSWDHWMGDHGHDASDELHQASTPIVEAISEGNLVKEIAWSRDWNTPVVVYPELRKSRDMASLLRGRSGYYVNLGKYD